jgi:hypothetical protein
VAVLLALKEALPQPDLAASVAPGAYKPWEARQQRVA